MDVINAEQAKIAEAAGVGVTKDISCCDSRFMFLLR